MIKRILNVLELIRYWQWQDKIQTVLIAILSLIIFTNTLSLLWKEIIIFFCYFYAACSYGYLINLYFDEHVDKQAKKFPLLDFSSYFVKILIGITGILTLFLPFLFHNGSIILLSIIIFFMATFYSAPPLRFKNRDIWGLAVAAITQRLPFLFFVFLIPEHKTFTFYLFGWLLIIGFLIELAHQIDDYHNDLKTGIKTAGVSWGIKKTKKIIYALFIILIIYMAIPLIQLLTTQINQNIFLSLILFIFSMETIRTTMESIDRAYRR